MLIACQFESSNSNTRKLDCLQTYMLSLEIGAWSGFNRRTELSEAFFQPIVTVGWPNHRSRGEY